MLRQVFTLPFTFSILTLNLTLECFNFNLYIFIPPLLQNPKVLVGYDAEVVRDFIVELRPFLRDGFTHECKDGVGELLLTWVVAIVGHVLMQDGPKPLNRIEMRAVGRQLD